MSKSTGLIINELPVPDRYSLNKRGVGLDALKNKIVENVNNYLRAITKISEHYTNAEGDNKFHNDMLNDIFKAEFRNSLISQNALF